ncbi:AMP-dependent synthetase/ligase [Mucilaginibacter sp. KACC 22063]|uniref:AMP-dependent synthetase/ligase n=1 Tax=Mucilaginibacter sp. KACC 22063 TaxID=3025666 RepID=UPI00236692E3|nr:long-chain fatty acid--CoA ligase [Mucilaginibacter sp. KACC 22063]WDF53886.1 long-chain fatty acid--CoA ligase [Mucilaginibacter sp. KACC 22063]
MDRATRLFDCIPIQAQKPQPDLLNAKINGVWKAYSTAEVHDKVYQLAAALLRMGISTGDGTTEGRDKIGLVSSGRPEWLIVDLAVQLVGAVLVPLYPNSSLKEIEQILIEAEVKCIFVSDTELCSKVSAIKDHVPSLKAIFSFDDVSECINWSTLLKNVTDTERSEIDKISVNVTEDDVTTIIFTSGTTGRPKGVMLTHKNIVSNVSASSLILGQIPVEQKKALSFLPLNHIFEKMCTYIYLFNGFSIHYAESMDTIGANMKEAQPYIFTAVPRLLEKVFEKIMIEGNKLTGIKRNIFLWSIKVAEQFENTGRSAWYNIKLAIADKLVYSKWRAAIGGNVKAIIVGSSACPIRLERIFTAAGMVVMQGYGLTETSPVIAVNQYDPYKRKFGTVGPLLSDVEVKIAEDGEILTKGPNVMAGYYKNPELTAEVIEDGWFHTGDIGELDSNGFLKITDRKKEIFKTSGGKYVAPVPIENRMKESPLIEQMMVIGAERKFTSALIVPSYPNLKLWCDQNKLKYLSHKQIIDEPQVQALFQSIVEGFNKEFNHVEQVKKITLMPDEWTIDGGELTPTGKMKRRIIMDKYKNEIERMYTSDIGSVSVTH